MATDLLQGDKVVTSSHVVPTIMGLRNALTATTPPTSSSARQLRDALLASLNRRFADAEEDDVYLTSTIVDPRFKLLPWSSSLEREKRLVMVDSCSITSSQSTEAFSLTSCF